MSTEDFQLIGDNLIDTSIIKSDLTEVYHPIGAQLNDGNQLIEFVFCWKQ